MKQTLNVDNFIQYAYNTGKYNDEQLQAISDALYTLEGDMAQLSWKENGLYSHEYIYYHLTKCCNKLKVYMMTCGLKQAKATSAIADNLRASLSLRNVLLIRIVGSISYMTLQ